MGINTVNHISKLNYELRAIRGAMALFSGENVAIRVSCAQNGDNIEKLFAYLPKSITPQIYSLLASAETSIMEQLEML